MRGEHSRKEPSEQFVNRYSEHLQFYTYEPATVHKLGVGKSVLKYFDNISDSVGFVTTDEDIRYWSRTEKAA
jgi:hypothetical protein